MDDEIAALIRDFARVASGDKLGPKYARLSLLNLRILSLIYFRETPPSMRDIAEANDISMPSASVILDRLEEIGLAERRNDTIDRRLVHVYLTDDGRAMIETHIQRTQGILKKALTNLTENDKTVVLKFFKSYLQAIKDDQATREINPKN